MPFCMWFSFKDVVHKPSKLHRLNTPQLLQIDRLRQRALPKKKNKCAGARAFVAGCRDCLTPLSSDPVCQATVVVGKRSHRVRSALLLLHLPVTGILCSRPHDSFFLLAHVIVLHLTIFVCVCVHSVSLGTNRADERARVCECAGLWALFPYSSECVLWHFHRSCALQCDL